jgi:hypothetical protein
MAAGGAVWAGGVAGEAGACAWAAAPSIARHEADMREFIRMPQRTAGARRSSGNLLQDLR